jgi:hypothetical protein
MFLEGLDGVYLVEGFKGLSWQGFRMLIDGKL